tara:strand:- start:1222 stop:1647 length:426 start_codon:yes stop_codon:yes gene_type:complete
MGRGSTVNPKPIWNQRTPTKRLRGPQLERRVTNLSDEWNRRYSVRRCQAKFRREEWAFTPDTYWKMWVESGRADQCGRRPDQYCMVRVDKLEAWGPHNCIIVLRRTQLKKLWQDHYRFKRYGKPEPDWNREVAECKTGNQE